MLRGKTCENDGGKAVATQPYIIQIFLASLEVRFSEIQERLTGKDRGSALPWEASNANVIKINLQTLTHALSLRIEGVGRSGYDKDRLRTNKDQLDGEPASVTLRWTHGTQTESNNSHTQNTQS